MPIAPYSGYVAGITRNVMIKTHTIYTPIAEAMLRAFNKLIRQDTWLETNTYGLLDKDHGYRIHRPDWNAKLSFRTYQRLVKEGIMPPSEQVTKTPKGAWMASHA